MFFLSHCCQESFRWESQSTLPPSHALQHWTCCGGSSDSDLFLLLCVLASNIHSYQNQCIFFCRSSQCPFIYSMYIIYLIYNIINNKCSVSFMGIMTYVNREINKNWTWWKIYLIMVNLLVQTNASTENEYKSFINVEILSYKFQWANSENMRVYGAVRRINPKEVRPILGCALAVSDNSE